MLHWYPPSAGSLASPLPLQTLGLALPPPQYPRFQLLSPYPQRLHPAERGKLGGDRKKVPRGSPFEGWSRLGVGPRCPGHLQGSVQQGESRLPAHRASEDGLN